MNPTAVLALIGDLYAQIAALTEEVNRLRGEQNTAAEPTT